MTYDFSHLLRTETISIEGWFGVTLREIPHGEVVGMQAEMFKSVKLDMSGGKHAIKTSVNREVQRVLNSGEMSPTEFQDQKMLLGIESWTLQDYDGNDVPVCMDAWKALPHAITERIEKAIGELNPDLDEEFPGKSGDGSKPQSTGESSA